MDIKKQELPKYAQGILKHLLDEKGEVIYSSHETIKKGDVYLLGLNPGGNGQQHPELGNWYTIRTHLQRMLVRTENSYFDEKWKNEVSDYPKGDAPLQKRVKQLLTGIGIEDPKTVCSSNIIFKTSQNTNDLCFGLAGLCWPVHEAILSIIQPKLILTFGISQISAYAFLKSLLHKNGPELTIKARHGEWMCKGFHYMREGIPTFVAAVPHLSYYSPTKKDDVFKWIREQSGI
jgi:hypothetical protein